MSSKKAPTVIDVKNVSKDFYLPHEKSNSLKSKIVNVFKKKNKEIDTQHALRDISFSVKKGEFFGILGRNGSGKSTLLKILAEIYQTTGGSITTKGKLVPFIELGVGFNPELTGRENVYLNGALLGFSRKEISERYDDIVRFAELENFMDQKLKNYSSGMQVRLAFSVATRAKAEILLVDEVLAVGDADFQRKCYDYFKSLKKQKVTVVFVTHDMGAVREYCDKAILIENGLIVKKGPADKVSDEYLKLFNKQEIKTEEEKDTRWGNGQVKIAKFEIDVAENITIKTKLVANNESVDGCVFDYNFTDNKGDVIMGGSTAYDDIGINLKSKESAQLSFVMPNILGSGRINVNATVKLGDGVTVCDSWESIETLDVTKKELSYPIIAPSVTTISYNKQKKV